MRHEQLELSEVQRVRVSLVQTDSRSARLLHGDEAAGPSGMRAPLMNGIATVAMSPTQCVRRTVVHMLA